MSGWIKLHRSLKDWEWYDDHNATRLLIHLLVSVNYEDRDWKGQKVKSGTLITSWENLSKEIGLSVKQLRVAMAKLEASQQVARYTTNKWQAISLVKWDKLQACDLEDGKQKGRKRATTKESKEIKEEIYIPEFSEFLTYALKKEPLINQTDLKLKYESWVVNEWRDGHGNKISNWKSKLLNTLPYIKKITSGATQIWEGC